MAINKVIYGGNTLLDVTGTTATAADVASGKQFVSAAGVLTNGTASGGNFVTGTFKGTTTGAAMDINIPYTGNGYPIAIMIYPAEGTYKEGGSFYQLVQRYVIAQWFLTKGSIETLPTYSGSAANSDYSSVVAVYKSNASNSTTYTRTGTQNAVSYNNRAASNTAAAAVRIKNKNTLSVFIASDAYGFAANYDYTYYVIYSE